MNSRGHIDSGRFQRASHDLAAAAAFAAPTETRPVDAEACKIVVAHRDQALGLAIEASASWPMVTCWPLV